MSDYQPGPGFSERPQAGLYSENSTSEQTETSLSDIIRFVVGHRFGMLAGGTICAAAMAVFLIAKESVRPSPVSYSSAVTVTMNGVENGKYPNNAPYSVTDLRSAAVLEEVYRVNNLQDYKIDLASFAAMVSVASYSPSHSILVERYRQRLSAKELTFEERKVIESEFQQSLASLNASGVMVTFTVNQDMGLPEQIGTKVVDDIPRVWADVYTRRLGVSSLPVEASGSSLVDEKLAAKLDYPLGYDYLIDKSAVVAGQINALKAIPGIDTFVSSTTSKSLSDITRDFASFKTFQLDLGLKPLIDAGLSKEPEFTSIIYENLIRSLSRDADVQLEYATKIDGALRSLNSPGSAPAPVSAENAGSNFTAQIDGAFIDKIVDLSEKGSVLDFEKDLRQQQLAFEKGNVDVSDRLTRLNDRLAALKLPFSEVGKRQQMEKRFVAGYADAIINLNSIWSQLTALSGEFSGNRLNYDKALYRYSSLPAELRLARESLVDVRFAQFVGLAALLGAITVLGMAYIRSIIRRR